MNVKLLLGIVLLTVAVSTSAVTGQRVVIEFLDKLEAAIVKLNNSCPSEVKLLCDAILGTGQCTKFPDDLEFCSSVDTLPETTKWDKILPGLTLFTDNTDDLSLVRAMDRVLGKVYDAILKADDIIDSESPDCRNALSAYMCTNGMAAFGEAGDCSEGNFACREDCQAVINYCFVGTRAKLATILDNDEFCFEDDLIEDIFGDRKLCPLKLLEGELDNIMDFLSDSEAVCDKLNQDTQCRDLELNNLLNTGSNNPGLPPAVIIGIICGALLLVAALGATIFYRKRSAAAQDKAAGDMVSSDSAFTQVSDATRG